MFVRGSNPIWFFDNLTAQPFDDTYYAFFLTNDLPYVNQAVYQDPDGITLWSDPIEFQPSSGLPNNIYGDPDLVYRLEFRNGPTRSDPLIYLVQNYKFGNGSGGGGDVIADPLIVASNMITNPNFSDIYFSSPLTITVAGNYDIAPGWQLRLTGAGSTTVTQGTNDGISNTVGNPPYFLSFSNSGWTSIELVQRFTNNGAIFGGGAAAIAFTADSTSPPQPITVSYSPSTISGVPPVLFSGSITSSAFSEYKNAIDIPISTNTDVDGSAYVEIVFTLSNSATTSLTNIQFVGQNTPLSSGFTPLTNSPSFAQETYERIVDQEFHVYRDSLLTQPKENILVGWTFALNPFQFTTKTITNVATFGYVADQTIIAQQSYVSSLTGNSISTGQGTAPQNFPFLVQAVSANNQFAMIQYIDAATIAPYWNQILSSMVNANLSSSNSVALKFKMRLIYRVNVPPTMSQNEPIASWTLGNDPVFSIGWNAIVPLNDPIYTLTTTPQNFPFDRFQLPLSSTNTMTLGIVIYTVSNMDSITPNSILFNRVSLVPNDFAIDASIQTWDESFRRCQYYYETTYTSGIQIGTPSANYFIDDMDAIYIYNVDTTTIFLNLYRPSFSVNYKEIKRINPSITFYSSQDGAINNLSIRAYNAGAVNSQANVNISGWNLTSQSTKSSGYRSNNTGAVISFNPVNPNFNVIGELSYHYTSDARMGLGIG